MGPSVSVHSMKLFENPRTPAAPKKGEIEICDQL